MTARGDRRGIRAARGGGGRAAHPRPGPRATRVWPRWASARRAPRTAARSRSAPGCSDSPPTAPPSRCHHGGLALRAHGSVTVALTGAPAPATVDGSPVGPRRAVPRARRRGARPRPARRAGCAPTSVSAVASTWPPVLGSRSHDTLSGDRPGAAARRRPAAGRPPDGRAHASTSRRSPHPSSGTVTLDAPARAPARLAARPRRADLGPTWTVDAASDRVGVRLDGAALRRAPRVRGSRAAERGRRPGRGAGARRRAPGGLPRRPPGHRRLPRRRGPHRRARPTSPPSSSPARGCGCGMVSSRS